MVGAIDSEEEKKTSVMHATAEKVPISFLAGVVIDLMKTSTRRTLKRPEIESKCRRDMTRKSFLVWKRILDDPRVN